MLDRRGVAWCGFEFAEEEFAGGFAEGLLRWADSRQRYYGQRGRLVVVGDYGQVARDAQAGLECSFGQSRSVFIGVHQRSAGAESLALGQERVVLGKRGRVAAMGR